MSHHVNMISKLIDVVLNRQWSIVVGLLAAGAAWALNENFENFPVEAAPLVAAVLTWLRVYSQASVDQLIADTEPITVGTIGDDE